MNIFQLIKIILLKLMKFLYLLYVLFGLFYGIVSKKRYLEDPSYNPIPKDFETQDYGISRGNPNKYMKAKKNIKTKHHYLKKN